MVGWHKRNKTLAEVGDNPTEYRERIAKETREALIKDPEFRKPFEKQGVAVKMTPNGHQTVELTTIVIAARQHPN